MEKDICLIGSGPEEYVNDLNTFLENNKYVWTGWTFKIREAWREKIIDQLKKKGLIPLYIYYSKIKGGEGLVEYILWSDYIIFTNEPISSPDLEYTTDAEKEYPTEADPTHTWFRIVKIVKLTPPRKLSEFKDVSTGNSITPSQLRRSFGYAYEK